MVLCCLSIVPTPVLFFHMIIWSETDLLQSLKKDAGSQKLYSTLIYSRGPPTTEPIGIAICQVL